MNMCSLQLRYYTCTRKFWLYNPKQSYQKLKIAIEKPLPQTEIYHPLAVRGMKLIYMAKILWRCTMCGWRPQHEKIDWLICLVVDLYYSWFVDLCIFQPDKMVISIFPSISASVSDICTLHTVPNARMLINSAKSQWYCQRPPVSFDYLLIGK